MKSTAAALLSEAAKRGLAQRRFDLRRHSLGHPKQLAFTQSRAKYRTACCSRRAGKSEGAAGLILETLGARPGCVVLYLTKTRINAKRIIWGVLKRLEREQRLGATVREAELSLEMPNGSTAYLAGVNNKDEIEKYRGLPIALVIIDEAQVIGAYLQELVDEVLAPTLMDYDGGLVLIGTPAPVPSGYFYNCIQNPEWEHHAWTVFDNPHILRKSGKTAREHLEAELRRRGVGEDEPTIQREWFGRWAYDPNALVFRYQATLNDYDVLPEAPRHGEWQHVVCGDLGWDDADALAVLKWHEHLPFLWLVYEDVMPKQTITALGDKLKALEEKYNPRATVLDFGGLGKKIAEELRARWGLSVEAADKARKLEHIELLNDGLRTGVVRAKKDSRFAQDAALVEWDKSNPEKWTISDRFHSDICDAVLYGYVRCYQWLSTPAPKDAPRPGSQEALAAERMRREKELEETHAREAEEVERAKRGQDGGWTSAEAWPWG